MSFRICCPECGSVYVVAEGDVGRTALCRDCELPFIISKVRVLAPASRKEKPRTEDPWPDADALPSQKVTRNRPPNRDGNRRTAWMGIVLGVTLAVVAFLIILGLPTAEKIKQQHHQGACRENLRQIAAALHAYHQEHGMFPPAYTVDAEGNRMHSWRVLILPYLDQQPLYDRYQMDEPWDGPNNRRLWTEMPDVFRCPSGQREDEGRTPYQVVVGEDTVFQAVRSSSLADIPDGPSKTFLVIESGSDPVRWLAPKDVRFDRELAIPNAFWNYDHDTRLLYASADGQVREMPTDSTDEDLFSLIEQSDDVRQNNLRTHMVGTWTSDSPDAPISDIQFNRGTGTSGKVIVGEVELHQPYTGLYRVIWNDSASLVVVVTTEHGEYAYSIRAPDEDSLELVAHSGTQQAVRLRRVD